MSKREECKYYFEKGKQDAKDGVYRPPSENIAASFRAFDDATLEEVEAAYNAGHSAQDDDDYDGDD